jgi:hypothetical protein
MARDFSEVLQQAMEFFVAGQVVEARALLLDVVRADSKVEAGWMFLSYTLDDPNQKADCLRKVLAINPQNTEAQTALQKLEATLQTGSKPPPRTSELLRASELIHAAPFTVDIDQANEPMPYPDMEAASNGSQERFPPSAPIPARPSGIPPAAVAPVPQSPSIPSPTLIPAPLQPPGSVPIQTPTAVAPAAEAFVAPFPAHMTAPSIGTVPPETSPASGAAGVTQPAEKIAPAPIRKTGQLAAAHTPAAKPGIKQPAAQATAKPKKRGNLGCTCLVVGMVVVLIVALIGAGLWMTGNLPAFPIPGQNPEPSIELTPTLTQTLWVLPPEATETPTPTITLTPTISPTPTPTLTPTLALPDATLQADMERLKAEVEDLRGLKMGDAFPVYVVETNQAEIILQAEYDRIGYRNTIQNEAKALTALGFIKPTYDLAKYALSRLADGVLGFYMPSNKTIYIIGNRFAGMERWTFTHEFDHALVHHFYPAVGIMEDDPVCANDSQRCEAIRALVEGDATLLMIQWREQYATAYDERDIALAPRPFILPPEQNTPAYMAPAVEFSYYAGANFVYNFWTLGNWARVNKIYENLPLSTEQILHPQKYLDGEKPITMKIPNLETTLGDQWALVKSDSMGEFMTYLLLAYGADNLAQITTETAATATAGWGGDHYLVFSASQGDQLLLAAEWSWDSDKDTAEYLAAMQEYLGKRFRGAQINSSGGECWSVNQETTCLFRSGNSILWVLAPDLDTITSIRLAYGKY